MVQVRAEGQKLLAQGIALVIMTINKGVWGKTRES